MLQQLNQAIDYIEKHLFESDVVEQLPRRIGVAEYHFKKVFVSLAGMTISEYVRKRRLSEASKDLLAGSTVTDTAVKYGYQSVDGFSRAFKRWSGMLPSEAVRTGSGAAFPRISFVITVTGGLNMDYRIQEMPAFNFVGVSARVPMQFEGVNQEIIKLAQSITENQRIELRSLQNLDPKEIVNVSHEADGDFMKEEGYLTHMIGVLTTRSDAGEGLAIIPVEAGTWAVFPNEGAFPEVLQSTMARVYSEWLPTSDYELVNAPSFSFTKMDQENPGHAYAEIWIPVR